MASIGHIITGGMVVIVLGLDPRGKPPPTGGHQVTARDVADQIDSLRHSELPFSGAEGIRIGDRYPFSSSLDSGSKIVPNGRWTRLVNDPINGKILEIDRSFSRLPVSSEVGPDPRLKDPSLLDDSNLRAARIACALIEKNFKIRFRDIEGNQSEFLAFSQGIFEPNNILGLSQIAPTGGNTISMSELLNENDFMSVLLHELGHFLGESHPGDNLNGPAFRPVPSTVMLARYNRAILGGIEGFGVADQDVLGRIMYGFRREAFQFRGNAPEACDLVTSAGGFERSSGSYNPTDVIDVANCSKIYVSPIPDNSPRA